ncbi:MAG: transposase/IS protein [Gemmataceae bacterium]|nr:transposase/IS protein [Gemmataceae bacterium]
MTESITTLREADQDRYLLRQRLHRAKLDLLVLNTFRYVRASKTGTELLVKHIVKTHKRTIVILTTNLPFETRTEPRCSGTSG